MFEEKFCYRAEQERVFFTIVLLLRAFSLAEQGVLRMLSLSGCLLSKKG